MKINKSIFLITVGTVYILISMTSWFRIKLAPPIEMTELNRTIYYFYHNLIHNWGFKVIIALIISMIVSLIIRKLSVKN